MATVSQTTFWKAFSSMNMYDYLLNISVEFALKVPIDSIPTLVQIMAWCISGDRPLSETMTVSLLTHMCVTQPQLL